ncbi:hypothetical protein NDU88_003023 [Pleurodeles waltl]|uniref:Secreted protein n=1 Tax=Pleurodeles waltl TaxID=8319 RepID=A0AAV7WQA6_PLEWA|nr:hypothetical protein NDU88_003023 [Pleurodeles waltl]
MQHLTAVLSTSVRAAILCHWRACCSVTREDTRLGNGAQQRLDGEERAERTRLGNGAQQRLDEEERAECLGNDARQSFDASQHRRTPQR